jgi:quercetin dioxygenase-like cupin family protein
MNDETVFIKSGDSKRVIEESGKIYKHMIESENMEMNIAELEAGTESRWFQHFGEEVHLVVKGKMEYIINDKTYKLSEGDILWHKSNLRHKAKNISDDKVIYLTVGTPPTFKLSMV